MRILILGATGPVGIQLIRQCLVAFPQDSIIIYARSPEKLPPELAQERSLVVIKGGLGDIPALKKALEGVDVVLSALGPSVQKGPFQPGGTPLAHAYEKLIELMRAANVRRIILLGTTSIRDARDRFDLRYKAIVTGISLVARNAYKDFVAIGEIFKTQASDLDYTIVRVPFLTNSESSEYVVGHVGDSNLSVFLSRAAYAAFVVNEINNNGWVKAMPLITSP